MSKNNLETNSPIKTIKNLFLIAFFLAFSYLMVICSYALANYKFRAGIPLEFTSFGESFIGLISSKKQLFLYLIIELSCLGLIILWKITSKNNLDSFKSNTIKITEDIEIPVAMGEGQHGTSRFATDKEKQKIFEVNEITLDNLFFKNQLEKGKEKIAKVNEFIKNRNNNEKDISDEEKILQEENDVDKLLMEIDDSEIIKANEEQNIGFTENYTNILQEINDKYKVKNDLDKINEKEIKYDKNKDKLKFFKSGGLVVGIEPVYSFSSKFKKKNKKVIKEKIYYVKDKHCLTIGATGCGKTRSEVLQTIGNVGLAGESLIVSDPKLELYEYTNEFLKDLDYEVICIDFKNPNKSSKYNILQPIIEAYNENDIEKVQNYTEELANILTPESKGEKIWYNGEKSMTSGAILSCILHNKEHPEFQNMSNVYNFVAKAGGTTEIESPYGTTQSQPFIKQYCDSLPPESLEAKSFATVTQAGDKQRESYITSSLSSLRLFSTKSMWEITHKTDCNIFNAGEKKIALFIGLPDEDTSYYPVASTIVCQIYNMLVKKADKIYGGTLPIRVNFILDEFGNFVKIPDINAKLTVARSRGIKFMLFLQSLSQLEEKYGKQGRDIIVANCQTWSYLLANDVETLDLVSKKLGKYTVGTGSTSKSGNNGNVNYSTSQNLTARSLLLPEELQLLKRPYNLILSENRPAMMECPDISKISFNQMFAMGDQEHNNNLRLYVEENRPFNISKEKEEYWDAFKDYRQVDEVA